MNERIFPKRQFTFVHAQHTATLLWHGYRGSFKMHFRVLFLSHDIGG